MHTVAAVHCVALYTMVDPWVLMAVDHGKTGCQLKGCLLMVLLLAVLNLVNVLCPCVPTAVVNHCVMLRT